MEKHRVEAFSDGVFAVAITLLIFNIVQPHVGDGQLFRALRDQWPGYASYAVSFLVIGIIWVNHHGTFRRIGKVDRPLLFFNLLLLMTVVFIPFPTGLMATYIQSGENSHIAAAVYSITMTLMGVAFGTIWGYAAYHPDLLAPDVDRELARASVPRFVLGTVIYVFTIGIAFISAALCLIVHAIIALYYVFDQTAAAEMKGEAAFDPLLTTTAEQTD